jgi:glycosyltransferase involved in cell wall biosynthesis
MNTPLVSVVIPTYNRAGVICETIDNVFKQTYSNFELIIVDDGSKDDTLSRLRAYGDRIRVLSQANAGPAVARNRGVEAAHGEIIAFQDSDDSWKPAKLERQVALLEANPSAPCCLSNVLMRVVDGKEFTSFDYSLIDFRREEGIWLNVAEVLATRFVLFNQAVAIRRDSFEKVGGFDAGYKYLEDYDLPLRLSFEGPWAFIREPMVIYREGSTESFSEQALKNKIILQECAVKIFEQTLARVEKEGRSTTLQDLLKRRLGMFRRQLKATRLKLDRTGPAGLQQAISKLRLTLDHYRFAAFRRSPWFPQPETRESAKSARQDATGEELA